MREIPVGKRKVAIIDDYDFSLVSKYKWSLNKDNRYHERFYAFTLIDGKHMAMHRLILDASPGKLVDHIDNDGLNNARGNIRIYTYAENSRNRKNYSKSNTGYKGVRRTPWNSYEVRIGVNGKKKRLGEYRDLTDAVMAYNNRALKYHKEFSNLNEIPTREALKAE